MKDFEDKLMSLYEQTNEFGRVNGMNLIAYKAGEVDYEMEIKPMHLATPTTAHGGILAAYMDAIMGVVALTSSAKNLCLVSTVEFKINYLKPAFVKDILKGKGTIISEGKRIIIAKGEIYNQNSDLIAVATGTFNAYPYQKSGMVF